MSLRLGLIADIHGNLEALEAVLADLEARGVNQLLCLGDLAVLGPEPEGVLSRLRDLACPSVLGNTDGWLLDPPVWDMTMIEQARWATLTAWCDSQLSPASRSYLAALPTTLERPLPGGRLLAFHGSPQSYNDVIAATTPDAVVTALVGETTADLLVGGHTHVQLLRRFGGRLVINPGSVGLPGVGPGTPDLPVNTGVCWAEYAILTVEGGRSSIDFRRLPVPVERILQTAVARRMPHLDWWTQLWAVGQGGHP